MNIHRLALSGLFRSGKDHIAELAGYQILSFAEPMYRVVEHFDPSGICDKDRPDHRSFLQRIGQWGWGAITNDYPLTPERVAFCELLRVEGKKIPGAKYVRWEEYGTRKDFWVRTLIRRLEEFDSRDPVAVTNVRFAHEAMPLATEGFEHYLVMCTEGTRAHRNGGSLPEATKNDLSEQYAQRLATTLPDDRIIWNDDVQTADSGRYLSVQEFLEIAKGTPCTN